MAYTETTSRSWFGRLKESFKGIIVGLIFVAGGVMLLFWGEGRAVKRAKALEEGASTVISVSAQAPQPGNEGKLVHFSGLTETFDELRDPLFGVITNGVKLVRNVEMYQWEENSESEERNKLGGGTETVTTYTYEKTWSSREIDSSSFKEREGHENPSMPFSSETFVSEPVVIGDWILGGPFVGQLDLDEPKAVGEADLSGVSETVRDRMLAKNDGFYLPAPDGDGISTRIGDVRVSFQVVPHTTVSVVGRQVGNSLVSYQAKTKSNIHLLEYGSKAADAMFETAKQQNTVLTWVLRGVGFFVIFIGLAAILKPLSVIADVVPFIGNVVEAGTTFIAFLLAAILSLITIAVGWMFYRPLLGITLLVVVGLLLWWMLKKLRQSEAAIHDKWTGSGPPPAPGGPAGGPPPPPPAG